MNNSKNIIKRNNIDFLEEKEKKSFSIYIRNLLKCIWLIYLILIIIILSIGLKKHNNMLYLTVKDIQVSDSTASISFYNTNKKPQADSVIIKRKDDCVYIYPIVRPLYWLYNKASTKFNIKDKRIKDINIDIKGVKKIYLKDKSNELLIYEK